MVHPSATQLNAAERAVALAREELERAQEKLAEPKGVVTQLAAAGDIVQPGATLYTLDGTLPVVLLRGSTPAWRTLEPGISDGADVLELETNLVALGYGSDDLAVDDHWDDATTAAVKRWQHALGIAETGVIELGAVLFEPGGIRVTDVSATLGGTIAEGAPVLSGTSTNRVVAVNLGTAVAPKVTVGDPVDVLLPDGTTTTKGKVAEVSDVATAGQNGSGATIGITVTLDDPSATGSLDQAPVQVAITTDTAAGVLAVPIEALVALREGGYAVEAVDAAGTRRYIGVDLGLFANGWVEVTGNGLTEGLTVAVPR
jgi:hypothetical protein